MTKKLLITAGLPYSNGHLHVGHIAGAYLPADIFKRFNCMLGKDVLFVCGSDDYGVPITLTAEREGKTPGEVAAFYNASQAEDFRGLGIHFDVYGSTSANPYHTQCAQEFFKSIHDKGYFSKESMRQFYDPQAGRFLQDRYVVGTCGYCGAPGQNSDQCEECGKVLDIDSLKDPRAVNTGTAAEIRESVHWFLDLRQFEAEVATWMETAQLRSHTKSYVSGLLSAGLVKRAMTRDLQWGVPVPLDDPDAKGKVLYVWFDAPIGYISNTMQWCAEQLGSTDAFASYWKSPETDIFHFIGEDNTIFHAIIWIAMLRLQGDYSLPTGVIVNQYLNFQTNGEEVSKMSKSRGTAVWIKQYLAEGGDPDSLRYYLTLVAPERARSVYNASDLIQRHNSDLSNTLGNLLSRVVAMSCKNVGALFPAQTELTEKDKEHLAMIQTVSSQCFEQLEKYQFKTALESLIEFARSTNRFLDERKPWTARKDDPEDMKRSLWVALESLRFLSIALEPFIPFAAARMRSALGVDDTQLRWDFAARPSEAFSLKPLAEVLFARIEISDSQGS
jgi:methionyl-tRNA synthetase